MYVQQQVNVHPINVQYSIFEIILILNNKKGIQLAMSNFVPVCLDPHIDLKVKKGNLVINTQTKHGASILSHRVPKIEFDDIK